MGHEPQKKPLCNHHRHCARRTGNHGNRTQRLSRGTDAIWEEGRAWQIILGGLRRCLCTDMDLVGMSWFTLMLPTPRQRARLTSPGWAACTAVYCEHFYITSAILEMRSDDKGNRTQAARSRHGKQMMIRSAARTHIRTAPSFSIPTTHKNSKKVKH